MGPEGKPGNSYERRRRRRTRPPTAVAAATATAAHCPTGAGVAPPQHCPPTIAVGWRGAAGTPVAVWVRRSATVIVDSEWQSKGAVSGRAGPGFSVEWRARSG